ncbi:SDR family NAD(P)-dependent oxidoreductase [Nocardia anaemiae]|uniref:SDR family NAD(P)-dependent oxidoreductase n=1 Tax=Nocardia anaemiae TaxID=263910 RepID=UPI0012F4A91F|nr:SDR family NAD(P)-dependent oxidoreductase [Nocardia anaemiae]
MSNPRVAVITAAGGPMGSAIARRLSSLGYAVALNDRSARRLSVIAQELEDADARVLPIVGDATSREVARALTAAALEKWGRVDGLVNVAGGVHGPLNVPLEDITDEGWHRTIDFNLSSAFVWMQEAGRVMLAAGSGRIVNIGSTSWSGSPDRSHYAAAKAGLVALTRSAATQWARRGVNVNIVVPGATATTVADRGDGTWVQNWASHNPLGRPNNPEDIADSVEFLVSKASRNITGQILTVAGGLNPSL